MKLFPSRYLFPYGRAFFNVTAFVIHLMKNALLNSRVKRITSHSHSMPASQYNTISSSLTTLCNAKSICNSATNPHEVVTNDKMLIKRLKSEINQLSKDKTTLEEKTKVAEQDLQDTKNSFGQKLDAIESVNKRLTNIIRDQDAQINILNTKVQLYQEKFKQLKDIINDTPLIKDQKEMNRTHLTEQKKHAGMQFKADKSKQSEQACIGNIINSTINEISNSLPNSTRNNNPIQATLKGIQPPCTNTVLIESIRITADSADIEALDNALESIRRMKKECAKQRLVSQATSLLNSKKAICYSISDKKQSQQQLMKSAKSRNCSIFHWVWRWIKFSMIMMISIILVFKESPI
ncbi:MAG: hypothetical protein EXX96DRAFT_539153 [Benjaminiella poitrasii]|nr:MAG: hypothetical protein EXX96DRAFT_539153 [Benjaminiella poitrasii]